MGKRPERQIALLAKLDIAFGYGPKGRGFESLTARHVGASSAYNTPSKGWGICMLPLLLLFRKKSRSAHLLGCKRPRDVSLSLPTSCGFKSSSAFYAGGFFIKSAATHIPLRLLSKSKPLRWVVILFLRRTAAIRRHTPSLAPPFGKKSRYAYAVRW